MGPGERLSGRNADAGVDGEARRIRLVVHKELEHVAGYQNIISYINPGTSANRLLKGAREVDNGDVASCDQLDHRSAPAFF